MTSLACVPWSANKNGGLLVFWGRHSPNSTDHGHDLAYHTLLSGKGRTCTHSLSPFSVDTTVGVPLYARFLRQLGKICNALKLYLFGPTMFGMLST